MAQLLQDSILSVNSEDSIKCINKAEQLVQNIYTKTAHIIISSRCEWQRSFQSNKRTNKWFNLETEEWNTVKEELKLWKSHSLTSSPMPPLFIEIYLDISHLPSSINALLLRNEENSRFEKISLQDLMDPSTQQRKNTILLESWQLSLTPSANIKTDLPILYKKFVAFFRHLHSFLRLLPINHYLRKNKSMNVGKVCFRISNTRMTAVNEAGLDQLHINGDISKGLNEMNFGSMETPFGPCNLHAMYRNACDFSLENSEMMLQERVVDFDDVYFVPSFTASPLGPGEDNKGFLNNKRISMDQTRDYTIEYPPHPSSLQIRKTSNTSLSTDMSSEPPKSLTSPLEFPISLQTNVSSKTSLLNPKASRASFTLQGSSLPSPSYLLAFTPPSAPSSLKSDPIKAFITDPPPFAFQDPPHSLALQPFPSHESPPFALAGGTSVPVAEGTLMKSSRSPQPLTLLRRSSLTRPSSSYIRPLSFSNTPPQHTSIFTPRTLDFNYNFNPNLSDTSPPAFPSSTKDSQSLATHPSPAESNTQSALNRFKRLQEMNHLFSDTLKAALAQSNKPTGEDDDLLFNMSELDI